jgi:phosphoglucosamine mutase
MEELYMRKYFGTDGIRRIANTELTPELVFRVAKAGAYVLSKHTNHTPTILIGKDTRISGSLIESAMVAGFLSYGANVELLGVIPTPAVAYLTKKLNADASVVISASHNTFEFNGIKYFSNKGMKIPDVLEEEIEKIMDSGNLNEYTAVNENIGISKNSEHLQKEYVDFITNLFINDIKGKLSDSFKVVIDTANGATYKVAEEIFSNLGINYTIINNKPNGTNINENCGSTHLEMLKNCVITNKYNMGIAYDGDGDRCLLIDEKGNVVDGDIILAILAKNLKSKGKLNQDTIVSTVMSNLGLSKFAKENKFNQMQTNVGDRYVLESMLKNGYNLGGEQSGHIILLDYNPTGDGILTSLMVIKTLIDEHLSLEKAAEIINIYPQVLVNAKVNSDKKYEYKADKVILDEIKQLEEEFNENGRILIRPSGTEPLVRVMIEGKDKEYILKKATQLASLIEERLK